MKRRVSLAPVQRVSATPQKKPVLPTTPTTGRVRRIPGCYTPSIEGGNTPRPVDAVEALQNEIKELSLAKKQELSEALLLQIHMERDASGKSRDLDMWSVAVHSALVRVIGGGSGGVPGPVLVKRLLAPVSIWGPVADFMQASGLDKLKVQERQAAYYTLAELLVGHARAVSKKSRAPLSVKLVGNCTGNLMGVFENAFPGYLQAGLAKVVAKTGMKFNQEEHAS